MTRIDLPKHRRDFYYAGICLIFLAVVNVFDYVNGIITIQRVDLLENADSSRILLLIYTALSIFSMMFQTFLGARAMSEAKHPTSASFHIKLAYIAIVFNALVFAGLLVDLFAVNSSSDIFSVILSGLDVALMWFYILEAQKVRVAK